MRKGRCNAERLRGDRALIERYMERRDPVDRDMLVERFLPLARGLARRYQRDGEPFDDLFQVACLGLVKAIDRFDLSRDVAFSSYAVPTSASSMAAAVFTRPVNAWVSGRSRYLVSLGTDPPRCLDPTPIQDRRRAAVGWPSRPIAEPHSGPRRHRGSSPASSPTAS